MKNTITTNKGHTVNHPNYYGGEDNDFLKENFSKIIGDRYERES